MSIIPKIFDLRAKVNLISFLIKSNKILNDDAISVELPYSSKRKIADLVLISKRNITSFEIKTEFDTLSKLHDQLEEYQKVFDYSYIVVAKKHIPKATKLSPDEIGIIQIENNVCKLIRRAKLNKKQTNYDMLFFLNKNEIIKISNNQLNRKLCTHEIRLKAATILRKNKIKSEIINKLLKKYINLFSLYIADYNIGGEDISYLQTLSRCSKTPINEIKLH